MAYQLQINLRMMGGNVSANDLDLAAYQLTEVLQRQIACKVFGYGVIEVEEPEKSRPVSPTQEPATAEVFAERSSSIRMMDDALL